MFLLGHSCWSYLVARASGESLNVRVPVYLALLAGVLPDFDIYFEPLKPDIHHTITHSILFLLPVSVLISWRFRRAGVAFSLGMFSHLFTDSLVGTIPLLYPVSNTTVGLSLGLPSVADTVLEVGALGVAMLFALQNGDFQYFRHPHRESLLLAIPLFSIVTLSLLFAGDKQISLVTLAFSRRALTAISLGHIVLLSALAMGCFQGLRGYLPKRVSTGLARQ